MKLTGWASDRPRFRGNIAYKQFTINFTLRSIFEKNGKHQIINGNYSQFKFSTNLWRV